MAEGDAHRAAEHCAKTGGAGGGAAAREGVVDVGQRGPVQDCGLVAGAHQVIERQDGGEVDEGARRRRDGDAAVGLAVARIDAPGAHCANTGYAPLGRRADLRRLRRVGEHAEQIPAARPLSSAPCPHASTAAR